MPEKYKSKETPGSDHPQRQPVVGVITTSFPVSKQHVSGIFVERLVRSLAGRNQVNVLIPCADREFQQPIDTSYTVSCFRYGPRSWQKLAHGDGGIPDVLKRKDPHLLLIPSFMLMLFFACFRLAGKCDILHGNWSVAGVLAAAAAKLRGKSSVVTLRGEDVTRAQASLLFRALLKICVSLNQSSICVSEAMRDELVEMCPSKRDRIHFIPNGVDPPAQKRRRDFSRPVQLVTVGSCIRRKRLDVILRAVAHERLRGAAVLRVIGDGHERLALEDLARSLSIEKNVTFVGAVAPEKVWDHLRWADIFVFSSESEGRPNVVLEAMAAGLPIVAPEIPGVSELIDGGRGVGYTFGAIDELADRIGEMIQLPDDAIKFGERAQRSIRDSGLSWASSAEKYSEIYDELMER